MDSLSMSLAILSMVVMGVAILSYSAFALIRYVECKSIFRNAKRWDDDWHFNQICHILEEQNKIQTLLQKDK